MTGENAPPLDGWVCYPRPCILDIPAPYEVAGNEDHLVRGEN